MQVTKNLKKKEKKKNFLSSTTLMETALYFSQKLFTDFLPLK